MHIAKASFFADVLVSESEILENLREPNFHAVRHRPLAETQNMDFFFIGPSFYVD